MGAAWDLWKQETPDELEWHYQLLKIYGNYGVLKGAGKSLGSDDQDLVWKLRDILAGHGVPTERTEERALAGLKKLGHTAIQTAMESHNVWHALKSAGSQPVSLGQAR